MVRCCIQCWQTAQRYACPKCGARRGRYCADTPDIRESLCEQRHLLARDMAKATPLERAVYAAVRRHGRRR